MQGGVVSSERGKRLSTKAQQGRSTASIDKLLPAGTVDLDIRQYNGAETMQDGSSVPLEDQVKVAHGTRCFFLPLICRDGMKVTRPLSVLL